MLKNPGNEGTSIRLAILDDYQDVAIHSAEQDWADLRRAPRPENARLVIQVFKDPIPTEDLVTVLRPFEVICTMRERTPFTAELFEALPNLKLLTTTGPVNRSIDIEAAKKRGVTVAGTAATGNSTVEHIWGLLLSVARNIPAYDRGVKTPTSPWQSLSGVPSRELPTGLMGKTIGLVGFGRLGSAVAKIADAFGMNVVAWSQNLTADKISPEQQEYVQIVSKRELFETSDFISIHLVLSPRSHGIIGFGDLQLMKRSAIIINTSRGPIIDEEALLHVLREGGIRGAGIDVFDKEPLPEDSPWRQLGDRVVLTPHVGYVETRNYQKFWEDTVWNVDTWLDGKNEYVHELTGL